MTFLVCAMVALWGMILKNGFRGYKIGGEVHKNLRNFPIFHESFTATWEFAKFWEVGRSNFGEKFSIFLIVEIFHALMKSLLWHILI